MGNREHRMSKGFLIGCLLCAALPVSALEILPPPVWTDAETAAREAKGFDMVGEYVFPSGGGAIQAALLKDGRFLVAKYGGGLPGAGWDESAIESRVMTAGELRDQLAGARKVERKSPTLGKPAPADAILVFPDDFTETEDGIMKAGGKTKKNLGSFHMHIEFLLPLKPGANPSSQHRGNSGIYIFNVYEVQILDSFALDLNMTNNAIETESLNKQWCGALYKHRIPDLNMSYPPLRWQTYDIDFHAPVVEGERVIRNARITVRHNGVLIHDNVELKAGTGAGAQRKQLPAGPVFFQNHKNPVLFRNIWATEL